MSWCKDETLASLVQDKFEQVTLQRVFYFPFLGQCTLTLELFMQMARSCSLCTSPANMMAAWKHLAPQDKAKEKDFSLHAGDFLGDCRGV